MAFFSLGDYGRLCLPALGTTSRAAVPGSLDDEFAEVVFFVPAVAHAITSYPLRAPATSGAITVSAVHPVAAPVIVSVMASLASLPVSVTYVLLFPASFSSLLALFAPAFWLFQTLFCSRP